jgi:hypothetical protein
MLFTGSIGRIAGNSLNKSSAALAGGIAIKSGLGQASNDRVTGRITERG